MASLRQELKQFEQQFRAEHGRDPSMDDIKQRPDIAKKYRDYAKAKASTGKEAKKASSSSSSSRPLAAPSASASSSSNPFRTPTKPKSARQRAPVASSTNDVGLSSETTTGPASPSRRLSLSKTRDSQSQSSTTTTRYVFANSPSKIRALAALHSSTGSPNQPSHFPSSPQKRASNPFASPPKGASSFAVLEKAERERLKQRKKEEKERKVKLAGKGSGGVLGSKATAAGAGWGSAKSLGERPFTRTSSTASSVMEVDEVDEFFGAPASSFTSQRSTLSSQRSLVPATQLHDNAGFEDDDDEVFGPSPVKPSSSLASKKSFSLLPSIDDVPPSSLPLFAPFTSQPGPSKPSKPLLPPAASPEVASQPSTRPVPFATALPFPSSSAVSGSNGNEGEREDFWADTAKKEEEAKKTKGARGGKRKKAGAAADESAVPSKRKAPSKRVAAKGKGKAKASAEDEVGEMDLKTEYEGVDGVTSSQKGEIVVALSDEEQEGGGKARLIIHEKGWQARAGQNARPPKSAKGREDLDEEPEGMAIDVMQGERQSDLEDEDVDDTSLFTQRGRTDLLSTLASSLLPPSNGTDDPVDDQPDTSNLPADLAAILSLRSNSPRKSSANNRHTLSSLAKEQQVARLLGEPFAGQRRTGGLLDLADGEGEAVEAEADDGEGDDDWDEEADGWEGTGEAMDGYYSGDGEVW